MTEDEATQKQCCGPEGCGVHNDKPYPAHWCVGSACMAWRCGKPEVRSQLDSTATSRYRAQDGWTITDDGRFYTATREAGDGHCGLAGAPR